MKHHPYYRDLLSGDSTRIAYGGRTLNEGGLQSLPQLDFPGGALIGCSAGMVNVAKIKGTHNAMKSGMLAAEAAYDALAQDTDASKPTDMSAYATAFRNSWAHADLHEVRNLRPSFNTALGIWGGVAYSGVDTLLLKGRTPWTFRNTTKLSDAAHTKRASECAPIVYPPFEPPLSTDLLTSLALTGTNHAEDQPVHLRVRRYGEGAAGAGLEGQSGAEEDAATTEQFEEGKAARREHVRVNVGEYAGLLGRACPAQVYEYVEDESAQGEDGEGWGGKKLVINSQVGVQLRVIERWLMRVPSELHTLQVVRYQGAHARHYMDGAGGWRRAQVQCVFLASSTSKLMLNVAIQLLHRVATQPSTYPQSTVPHYYYIVTKPSIGSLQRRRSTQY